MGFRRRVGSALRRRADERQRLQHLLEHLGWDSRELLPVQCGDRGVEFEQQLKSRGCDDDANEPSVAVHPAPLAEAQSLEPVDQARHVRDFGDHLRGDLVAAATFRSCAAENPQHVVTRLGQPEAAQHPVDLPLEHGRGAHDAHERLLFDVRKRILFPQFNGQWYKCAGQELRHDTAFAPHLVGIGG